MKINYKYYLIIVDKYKCPPDRGWFRIWEWRWDAHKQCYEPQGHTRRTRKTGVENRVLKYFHAYAHNRGEQFYELPRYNLVDVWYTGWVIVDNANSIWKMDREEEILG